MPSYYRLGEVPRKRHTQFRRPDGGLFTEEVFGTEGFHGVESILYHRNLPPRFTKIERQAEICLEPEAESRHCHRHLRTADLAAAGDPISGRRVLMYNADVWFGICRPADAMASFYKNARADELLYVHRGAGRLQTMFGTLPFGPGDYLVIPRGTTYRMLFEPGPDDRRFLFFEAFGAIETPRRYRNDHGQLMEHAPYCERDIRRPEQLETFVESGEFTTLIKYGADLVAYTTDYHPLDVVGWDGYLYPWALNIADFEPITGRIHQPPPVHQTFQGPHLVVCSFVPRKLDYHPDAVPVPYNHSNVDSDEMIYYVNGDFGSRKGVAIGSITLHPGGIPHGPQPGRVEASLGRERTDELAVMMDTFHPLTLTRAALECEDPAYAWSWLT